MHCELRALRAFPSNAVTHHILTQFCEDAVRRASRRCGAQHAQA